jgi:hypothetical protein
MGSGRSHCFAGKGSMTDVASQRQVQAQRLIDVAHE